MADGVTTIVLVDDDPLVRSGLALILGGDHGIEVVAQAENGREAIEAVRTHRPEVVLMDIRMPVLDGIEATRALSRWPHPPKVIVLTTFGADEHVVAALSAGADGFLLKDTPPSGIVDAVHRVAAGESIVSPDVLDTLIGRLRSDDTGQDERQHAARMLATLTEREREIARAVGRGLSNAEIGAELFLSVPTVKAHVGRLFAKLGLTNRVQVALLVHDAER